MTAVVASARVSPRAVGWVGVGIGCLLAVRLLIPAGWDASVFLALGDESVTQTEFARARLGEVVTRDLQGHDGKFFFIQALDPLYLEPDEYAVFLDRPRYRAQRMLFPFVAGLGGLVPAGFVPWAMALTSVVALGVGTWATAEISRRLGGSAWLGLAFALNLGVVSELFIGGAGILAFALAPVSVVELERDRLGRAAAALTAAALTREVMLLFAFGVGIALWRRFGARRAVPVVVAPLVAVGAWWLYLAVRLGGMAATPAIQEIDLRFPFAGMVEAAGRWSDAPLDLVFGTVMVMVLAWFVVRAFRRETYLGWGALGFVALGALLSAQVWGRYFDISRALAPVLTAYVVLLFVPAAGEP